MKDTVKIEDFPQSPPPPRVLYKYLSPDRIQNVLKDRTVRFTPLISTNDVFEIRATFEQLAGPRFQAMLAEQMNELTTTEEVNKQVAKLLNENGLGSLPTEVAIRMVEQFHGRELIPMLRETTQTMVQMMLPLMNSKDAALKMLERLGRNLLCFSLSENSDSTLMWAHYAASHTGLVVAFRTDNDFFNRTGETGKSKLQKVAYFDGVMSEPLENPQAAFISKTTEWEYEREWRLYAKEGDADLVVGNPEEPIHLIRFPADAVERVILGERASKETTEAVIEIVREQYDGVPVFRLRSDRMSRTFSEELLTS